MKPLPDHLRRMCAAALSQTGYVTTFRDAQPAIDTLCEVIRRLHQGLKARGATGEEIDRLMHTE